MGSFKKLKLDWPEKKFIELCKELIHIGDIEFEDIIKKRDLTFDRFHKLREYYNLEFEGEHYCYDNLVQYKYNGEKIIII